jgi:hypothetical protein
MPADEYEGLDQQAMIDAAETEAEAKPTIVYEEFKQERPHADLLNEFEIAALNDDGSADDLYDDEAEAPADAQAGADPEADAPAKTPAAAPPVDTSVDYAALIAETDTKLAELQTLLDDGEIGDNEYKVKVLELAEQRGDLRANAKLVDTYRAQTEAVAAEQWGNAVKGFKASHAHLFGPEHFDKFNVDVQGVTADPRFANLSFDQQLAKAAQDYAFRMGQPALAGKQSAPRPAAPKTPVQQAPKRQPVPTLARVSNTGSVAPDGGRYAAIDARIDAKDIAGTEAALSRMTKEQLEAYGAAN